ncbi:hypothetical protein HDU87_002365 [Geranomyces variabilis]|uniref:Uncharacterized protein n=1 Tax=Geranomyces variabilis TaxID=109894 RepID=A0AAD5TL87_9FUNG|nr:hypothetical protein HDU87_002365 [Geranomyces variabilis]
MDDPSSNCSACFDSLAQAQSDLAQAQADCSGALDDQALLFGTNADAIDSINAMVVNFLLIILLIDRIVAIKHAPTKYIFWLAVLCGNGYHFINILSDEVPWFYDGVGLWVYYYLRGIFSAFFSSCLVLLLYLRIAGSVQRHSGRRWWLVGHGATAIVWFLELFEQLFGIIRMQVTGDESNVYPEALMTTTTVVKTSLDVCFSLYTFWIIRAASGGPSGVSKGRQSLPEHTAFFVGCALRVLLFLGIDAIVLVTTQMKITYDDVRFGSMAIWSIAQLAPICKPYLICTDMARIRALMDEKDHAGEARSSRGGGSTLNDAGSKAGAPEPIKFAATSEINEPA